MVGCESADNGFKCFLSTANEEVKSEFQCLTPGESKTDFISIFRMKYNS